MILEISAFFLTLSLPLEIQLLLDLVTFFVPNTDIVEELEVQNESS